MTVIRRLRAHGLIPPGVPAGVERVKRSPRMRQEGAWAWYVTGPGGQHLNIGSRFAMVDLLAYRHWDITTDDDGKTHITPAGQ